MLKISSEQQPVQEKNGDPVTVHVAQNVPTTILTSFFFISMKLLSAV